MAFVAAAAPTRLHTFPLPPLEPKPGGPLPPGGSSASEESLEALLASIRPATSRVYSSSCLLVLGNPDSGRSALLRALQGVGRPAGAPPPEVELFQNTGAIGAVDYAFLPVRRVQEEEDILLAEVEGGCDAWVLQSHQQWRRIIHFLPPKALQKMAVVVCIDVTDTHRIIQNLKTWLNTATEVIRALEDKEEDMEVVEVRRTREEVYVSSCHARMRAGAVSSRSSSGSLAASTSAGGASFFRLPSSTAPARPEKAASAKLGDVAPKPPQTACSEPSPRSCSACAWVANPSLVPIVVVLTKCDSYQAPSASSEFRAGLSTALSCVRHELLPYGASLWCTSCATSTSSGSVLGLYQYLMHRLYGYPCTLDLSCFEQCPTRVCGGEGGSNESAYSSYLFIPAGFDSPEKVEECAAATGVGGWDKPYEALVQYRPAGRRALSSAAAAGEAILVADPIEPLQTTQTFLEAAAAKYPNLLLKPQPETEPATAALVDFKWAEEEKANHKLTAEPKGIPPRPPLRPRTTTTSSGSSSGSSSLVSKSVGKKGVEVARPVAGLPTPKAPAVSAGASAAPASTADSLHSFFKDLLVKSTKAKSAPRGPLAAVRPSPDPPAPVTAAPQAHAENRPDGQPRADESKDNQVDKRDVDQT
eukprot:GHVT01095967.1.p1 GENE.GHVT01095967.1~~GHVT01095967.1.p1  ORF type:complete len:645 (-),score=166.29 GHVT01095967.1:899-2833(-)